MRRVHKIRRMYKQCEKCGCSLDFGEGRICSDCIRSAEEEAMLKAMMVPPDESGCKMKSLRGA